MKRFFSFLPSVFLIFALVSCSDFSSDSSSATSLVIQLPSAEKSSRSLSEDIPDWAKKIQKYSVTLLLEKSLNADSDYDSQEKNNQDKVGKAGENIEFSDLKAGEYSVKVYAYDETDKIIGTGESVATVREGEVNSVAITIYKWPGSSENSESDKVDESDKTQQEPEFSEPDTSENSETDESDDIQKEPSSADTETPEITYGGTVSFNGTEYKTLAEALNDANAASLPSANSTNTITLNGNVRENLLTMKSGETMIYPWHISQNLIVDLNGKTLCWDKFVADEINTGEKPFFNVPNGKKLVLKNGTITSTSGIEHTANLLRTTGGIIVLDTITIQGINIANSTVKTGALIYISESSDSANIGSFYCKKVTIKNCRSTVADGGYPIFINASYFYASETHIENLLGDTSVILASGSQGAFVGGEILLTSSEKIVDNDSALMLVGSGTSFFIASSTIYSNSAVHGIPVIVSDGAGLNLADGFQYKYFDIDSFTVNDLNDSYIYADDESLNLTRGENVIAAAKSETITKSKDSTEIALSVGSDDSEDSNGNLFINGNSSIYGVTRLYLYSTIAQTGEITSDIVTRIYFGEKIADFANEEGNYPLYWGSGSDAAEENLKNAQMIPQKFAVYGEYFDENKLPITYKIGDSGRKVNQYAGESVRNTIYAPVIAE